MALSAYLSNKILDWFRGQPFPAPPNTVYVALFVGSPGAGGTEAPLARQPVAWAALQNPLPNATPITFPDNASGGVIAATHAATFDAATNGNMLQYGALVSPPSIDPNERFVFDAGEVSAAIS